MFGQKIFVVFIVSALTLPAVLGCLVAGTPEAQSMHCCAIEMSCPQHQEQTCVSTTAQADNLQPIPAARVSFTAPSLAMNPYPHVKDSSSAFFSSFRMDDAAEHSPPELYTLHSALLI
jgi:hypothetical protein